MKLLIIRSLKGLLYCIRPINLILVGLASFGFAQLLSPLYLMQSFHLILPILLVMGGGNLINDFFDLPSDQQMNRSNLFIEYMPPWLLIGYYIGINGLALFWVASSVNSTLSLVLIGIIFSLLLYARFWKRTFLIGNVWVSLLCAFVPWYVFLAHPAPVTTYHQVGYILASYSCILFMYTLIREMVKDIQDKDGDRYLNAKTLPLTRSEKTCVYIVTGLQFVNICVHLFISVWFLTLSNKLFIVFLVFCLLPVVLLSVMMVKNTWIEKPNQLSTVLKINIGLGILSLFFLVYF